MMRLPFATSIRRRLQDRPKRESWTRCAVHPEASPWWRPCDGQVVAHILFTPVTIDPPPARIRVAGLAPMAVLPDFQRLGIGGELIRAGFQECRRLRYSAVVVVGHPDYYPRFGFQPADTWGLKYVRPGSA